MVFRKKDKTIGKLSNKIFKWWCNLTDSKRNKIIEDAYNNE